MSAMRSGNFFDLLSLKSCMALLLCLLASTQVIAKSSVWKVEKNGQHIYLGGTIHLLKKSDYPLPGEYDLAYNKSQIVYFETDIERITSKQASGKMAQALKSKTNQTLDQVLKPQTLQALKTHLKKQKLPLQRFKDYSPSGVYLTLTSMELAKSGRLALGVDVHFAKRARLDKKRVGKLETIDQHLSFLSKMAGGNPDQVIMNGLQDMKSVPEMVSDLKKIWRVGNREQYNTYLINPYKTYYSVPYKILIVDRNAQWMPKLEAMLTTSPVEFILVGAMHLFGKQGLLQQLEAKGYTVTSL